jgi:hypothetical protein
MVGVDALTICCCCGEKGQVAKLHEQRLSWHWSLARDRGYSRATTSGDDELPGQAALNVFTGDDCSIVRSTENREITDSHCISNYSC